MSTSSRLPPKLAQLPRASLAHLPTPIEAMPNLTAHIGGAQLFVKRDDCTGLAMGGNKIRQLEFYLGEAVAQGADTLLITGAVQSNFVRSAVAAASRLGLQSHVQLEQRVARVDRTYTDSGNVLLDRLMGATIYQYPEGEDEAGADRQLEAIAADLRRQGRTPYIIHLSPGHRPLGALGYVLAAEELLQQIDSGAPEFDEVMVGSGSGHTHAGLLFGLRWLGCSVRVTGACVRRGVELQSERILARTQEVADLLEVENPVAPRDIELTDAYLAPGYGLLNDATADAISLAARLEAMLVDPVYTGKVMAAVVERAANADGTILFVHTGGTPALFAYQQDLAG